MTPGVIVGIDTSTKATAVAVLVPDGREVERRDDPAQNQQPRHAEFLQPLLEQALEQAGATWADVTRIAVGLGPGGFTGLRLGISTARALSQGHDLPVVGVSSLEALARGVELATPEELDLTGAPDAAGPVLAVIDARRGEVFVAAWRGEAEVFKPRAMTPESLADLAVHSGAGERRPWLAVGDGAVRFRDQLVQAGVTVPEEGSPVHRVGAEALCRLGAVAEPAPRNAVLPEYLRAPDAKPRP